MSEHCQKCWDGSCPQHPAFDEIDGLDLLIPAPRRSPENVPVP